MGESDREQLPREVENPSARPGSVAHWVTHARRRGLGMYAWALHRVTAVMVIALAVLHVLANEFGYIVPGGRLVTVDLLLFAGTYHLLNGVRVILIEAFGWAAVNEERLFQGVAVLTLAFIFWWVAAVGL